MTPRSLLFGEHARIKIAGLFMTRRQAAAAARRLSELDAVTAPQILLVGPPDGRGPACAPATTPAATADGCCVLRIHLVGGAVGGVLGLLLAAWLLLTAHPVVVASPQTALFAMVTFNGLIGVMVAGVAGLRPDHMRVAAVVRRALRHGRWAVVVHPDGEEQAAWVLNELEARSYRVVRSL